MKAQRIAGPAAGGLKYDLLTALSVAGLNGTQTLQTSLMRLIALVTARYNWRLDEFTVGQRDMARMWSVNERTVKREIKRLTEAGIVICKYGGVRGRVGAYRLNYPRIAELSRPSWALVGPDFERRMEERFPAPGIKVVQMASYAEKPVSEPEMTSEPTWGAVLAALARTDPGLTKAWFSRLRFIGLCDRTLTLEAPSAFVQRYIETHHIELLVDMVRQQMGQVDQVVFGVSAQ